MDTFSYIIIYTSIPVSRNNTCLLFWCRHKKVSNFISTWTLLLVVPVLVGSRAEESTNCNELRRLTLQNSVKLVFISFLQRKSFNVLVDQIPKYYGSGATVKLQKWVKMGVIFVLLPHPVNCALFTFNLLEFTKCVC